MDANINKYFEDAILKILIASGADIEKKDDYLETVLYSSCNNRKVSVVKLLLKAGANPDSSNLYHDTCLLTAIRHGYKEIAKILLANGANVNLCNFIGMTALSHAVQRGDRDLVKFLFNSGANLDRQDDYGKSALHHALYQNHFEIAELLIEAGADTTLTDKEGYTAYMLAEKLGNRKIMNLITEKRIVRYDPVTITAGMKGSRNRRKPNTETVYNLKQAYEFLRGIRKETPVIMQFIHEDDEYEFESIQKALDWLKKTFE